MFRTAVLRTAAQVSRAAAPASFAVSRAAAVPSFAPRAVAWGAIRTYAAAAGLKKEEVEGRIMALLKGFDKVGKRVERTRG